MFIAWLTRKAYLRSSIGDLPFEIAGWVRGEMPTPPSVRVKRG